MTLMDRIFGGADEMFALAENALAAAIDKYGLDKPVAFPDTAYTLACIYAFTGKKVTNLAELKASMDDIKNMMIHEKRVKDVFSSGIGTCLAGEVVEACKYIEGVPAEYEHPYHGCFSDAEIRELGVPLVTGDLPGVAAIVGKAPTDEEAVKLAKDYQAKGIFVFLVGECCDQCINGGVKMDFKTRMVSIGKDLSSISLAISVVMRTAIIFGNVTPGDWKGMLDYNFDRLNVVVNGFDPVADITCGYAAGAIALGKPVVTNMVDNMWAIPKSLVIQTDISKWIETSLEARGIKIKVTNVDIPVSYANTFEGEIIRKGDMQIEADGSRMDCFELVQTKDLSEVEDHKIEVIGKDFDEFAVGEKISMSMIVEVAGKNMQPDFESVFERKFHSFINCIEGVMHTGQRDLTRIRVSKDAFNAGFRAKHFGEVLYAEIKSNYDSIVDKCQVKIITDPAMNADLRKNLANAAYDKRDARLSSLTDENVDEFYTCILCQAFSPSHVCIVTPERLGLCGAVSWLDAKATKELDPNGPCQIVKKDHVIDEKLGRWDEVNEAVNKYSRGALESVTLYSIMEDPMTSCGCFECICGIEPMSNGVVIVNREHIGITPVGMSFSELASMTGGGVQTPGFMGHGKHFIASKKFMAAEGGIGRIVWLPKALKEQVAEKLNKTAKELYDIDNFADMIADEDVCTDDLEALMNFLTEKNHPVLGMEPMM